MSIGSLRLGDSTTIDPLRPYTFRFAPRVNYFGFFPICFAVRRTTSTGVLGAAARRLGAVTTSVGDSMPAFRGITIAGVRSGQNERGERVPGRRSPRSPARLVIGLGKVRSTLIFRIHISRVSADSNAETADEAGTWPIKLISVLSGFELILH